MGHRLWLATAHEVEFAQLRALLAQALHVAQHAAEADEVAVERGAELAPQGGEDGGAAVTE